MRRSLVAAAIAAAMLSHLPLPAAAQSQDYFIPGQAKTAPAGGGGQPSRAPRPAQRPAPAPAPQPNAGALGTPDAGESQNVQLPPDVPLPPPPELPTLPKGESPPVAIVGVMGVPEVMRASAAAQQVEKIIGERRNKLNEDAQKEQAVWREMQQSLANDRAKLSPDQIRTRERELQERITNAQRTFRDRNRIIQEGAQYALAQIERTLIAVIRQVAESRGMNLVLHRAQVALNVNQFDITDQVAEQLNKILPTVVIPPDGVSPSQLKLPPAAPAATAPATVSAPAAAPAAPAQ